MRELTPPDSHYLNAAAGWRELGNYSEARFELERILDRDHPAVLAEQWRICAAERHWLRALEVARRLIEVAPDDPAGWVHQSYSLHEMKRTREARDRLLAVAGKFSGISTIPYNLACYACQLGEFEQARDWLARAVRIAGREAIKKMAASDPDLQPMREEIKRL